MGSILGSTTEIASKKCLQRNNKLETTLQKAGFRRPGHNHRAHPVPSAPRDPPPAMKAYYSDQFVLPLPAGHRFPMAKYRLLRGRVASELPQVRFAQAPAASDAGNWRSCTRPATSRASQVDRAPDRARDRVPGARPWPNGPRRSVGATIEACRSALTEGVAANLAGGTHHAHADREGGFCVFDAAVAARLMQAEASRPRRNRSITPAAPAGGHHRSGRAPGQRHRAHLYRRR